jgi:hypothetical protein
MDRTSSGSSFSLSTQLRLVKFAILEKNSEFFTTQSLKGKIFWHDLEIDL